MTSTKELLDLLRGDILEFELDLGRPQTIAMLGRLDELEKRLADENKVSWERGYERGREDLEGEIYHAEGDEEG